MSDTSSKEGERERERKKEGMEAFLGEVKDNRWG
jgi:hypothetical protein